MKLKEWVIDKVEWFKTFNNKPVFKAHIPLIIGCNDYGILITEIGRCKAELDATIIYPKELEKLALNKAKNINFKELSKDPIDIQQKFIAYELTEFIKQIVNHGK